MAEEFLTQSEDQRFKTWMVQHPRGVYLNEGRVGNIKRSQGGMILHKVGCYHLGDGEGVISTTYAKVGADDVQDLRAWAERHSLTIAPCRSCKPD